MFVFSVVRFLVMAFIALALLKVVPGLAAPMVADVAEAVGMTAAEVWRVMVLSVGGADLGGELEARQVPLVARRRSSTES
jgi:hypothetical protein